MDDGQGMLGQGSMEKETNSCAISYGRTSQRRRQSDKIFYLQIYMPCVKLPDEITKSVYTLYI